MSLFNCIFSFLTNVIVYFSQKDFDLVLCRGTTREKIFKPWIESMTTKGCKFEKGARVTDLLLNEETGCISEVVCGKEMFSADAVVLAVGISTLQKLVENRYLHVIEFQNDLCKYLGSIGYLKPGLLIEFESISTTRQKNVTFTVKLGSS